MKLKGCELKINFKTKKKSDVKKYFSVLWPSEANHPRSWAVQPWKLISKRKKKYAVRLVQVSSQEISGKTGNGILRHTGKERFILILKQFFVVVTNTNINTEGKD